MEDQSAARRLPGGRAGFHLLAMASPQAGMAALTGTLAGTRRGMISFTQQNEQEADRIGIQVLQRAGFDPQAMPSFLEKLLDQRVTPRDRLKFCSLTPYRKAALRMPATVPTRCARSWCNLPLTSISPKRAPGNVQFRT